MTAVEPVANHTDNEVINDFESFEISKDVLNSVKKLKYSSATPIQKACIPYLLEKDTDIVALAKTGTGKTAAFGIPLVEKIDADEELQGLVLCPTRELAQQVALNIKNFGLDKGVKVTTILGGESYDKQIRSLRSKPHVIVSTPGRLIDLIDQKLIDLEGIKYLILDEADEMLSFGFQDALEEILKSIKQPFNTWLFSATMSDSIKKLSKKYLKDAHEFKMNTKEDKINIQSFAAVVFEEDKEDALSLLIKNDPEFYGIIFATTKKQVADLEIKLRKLGLDVDSLHGDKVQAERTRTVNRMKARQTKILVATDVAARGLDIQDLTHVVNFEIPWDVETYTHRIGRTARAGKTGVVWTMVRPKESGQLKKFERALGLEFKNLIIPTVEQVQVNQKVTWLKEIADRPFRESEFLKFEKALASIDNEKVQELSLETRQWLVKAFNYFGEGEELLMKQPRALELRKGDDFDRGSRSSGGGRGGFGRRSGGGNDRRSDSHGGGRGGFGRRSFGGSRDRSFSDDRPERSESGSDERRSRSSGRSEGRSSSGEWSRKSSTGDSAAPRRDRSFSRPRRSRD